MSLREEFVKLALKEGANRRELCRRFGISAKTGYKWLHRYQLEGRAGLADQPRRPSHSPRLTPEAIEAQVLALRAEHPRWGGRKLARRLRDLGHKAVPAPSTITAILARHGPLIPLEAVPPRRWQRFEHATPNAFWQMDFKGHFALQAGGRCHPLTVLDDHSRFNLVLAACADQRTATVKAHLSAAFRRYGLPECIGVDNGAPWGADFAHTLTPLIVWLLHLGVAVRHSRPYHPQTLGKDERFHRTFKAEVLAAHTFAVLAQCQLRFDHWRGIYNLERPHEALGLEVPVSRYQPSPRAFPESLPPIEYPSHMAVRKVDQNGKLSYQGHSLRAPKALSGYRVGLLPTETDGLIELYFCHYPVTQINLHHRQPES